MTYKTLSLQDLKTHYSDRHGFVFVSNERSSKESCQKLSDTIKEYGISEYEPDFIVDLNDSKAFAFVYPADTSFQSSDFFQFSQHASNMVMGMFKIDTLAAFLKNH